MVAGAQTPTLAASDLTRARALVEDRQYVPAEEMLRRALLQHGDDADLHFFLGYVLFREDRAVDSLAEYTAGAKTRTPSNEDLLVVASDYVLLKSYPNAERWLRYILNRDAGSAKAWYLLGRTMYNLDRVEEARKAFVACLGILPRDVKSEYNLGLVYEKLQRPDDARKAYETAIGWQKDAPVRDAQPYLDLGVMDLSQHRVLEALENLREACQISPGNPYAQEQMGLAMDASGDTAGAVAALARASELAPGAHAPHYFLARIYRRTGEREKAAAEQATVEHLLGTRSDEATPNVDRPR